MRCNPSRRPKHTTDRPLPEHVCWQNWGRLALPPPLPTLSHQGRGETQPRGQDAHAPRHAPCVTSLINFNRIAGFQWDQGNAWKSADKHGVTQAEAEQVFVNNTFLLSGDIEHSQSEPRFHALGVTDAGHRLHITFTLREEDTLIRVISARDMKHRERLRYEQET